MTKEGIYEYIARQKTAIISSHKVVHYRANPKACVYFYEKSRSFSGVELKGTMSVLTDAPTNQRTETVML